MDVQATREHICIIGRLLFERNLNGMSSGSISASAGKYKCMTPGHAGPELLWDLEPHQVLVLDKQGIKVDGVGEFPLDYRVHLQLYREVPNGSAVIFCQPPNIMAFCAAGHSLPPVLENSLELGEIGFCEFLPADSPEFAASVVSGIHRKESELDLLAAAVMSPWRGLYVFGRTLNCAFEAVERIEVNARTILMSSYLEKKAGSTSLLKSRSAELKKAFKKIPSS